MVCVLQLLDKYYGWAKAGGTLVEFQYCGDPICIAAGPSCALSPTDTCKHTHTHTHTHRVLQGLERGIQLNNSIFNN